MYITTRSSFVFIHRSVCAGQKFVHLLSYNMLRQSEGCTDLKLQSLFWGWDSVVSADPFLQPLNSLARLSVSAFEKNHKFISTPATDCICRAARRTKLAG